MSQDQLDVKFCNDAEDNPSAEMKSNKRKIEDEDQGSDYKQKLDVDATASEEPKEEEEAPEKYHVKWQYLTPEILTKCLIIPKPKGGKGSCPMSWLSFNHKKFAELCPDHPPISPRKGALYFDFPWLQTSFGYSPCKVKDGIANNLRFVLSEPVDKESEAFIKRMQEWDQWFVTKFYENRDSWPLGLKKVKDESDILNKYQKVCREPMDENGNVKPGAPNYWSLKMNSPKDDPYSAIVSVWNYDKQHVTEVLTRENAEPTEEEIKGDPDLRSKRDIIIPKKAYVSGIAKLEKFYFVQTTGFGPTFKADSVRVTTEENLRMRCTDKPKACPF